MIDVIKQTPLEYSKNSRDYQVIARLYSAIFNISKMYIDNLNIWNEDIDNKLVNLRAKTVNFDIRHIWDLNDLEAVSACFKYLMRNKGTEIALDAIINILMKIENINSDTKSSTIRLNSEENCVYIWVEKDVVSMGIIEDLIRYILPAGLTYRIIEYISYDIDDITTDVYYIGDEGIEDSEGNINPSWEPYTRNYRLYIGNDKEKQRLITETYIYDDRYMDGIEDSEGN